jgi:hypothetical protein
MVHVETLPPEIHEEVEGPSGALLGMLCTAFSGFFFGVCLTIVCFVLLY